MTKRQRRAVNSIPATVSAVREAETNYEIVPERWKLRNGSVAIITHRDGPTSVGYIEGTVAVHEWAFGRCRSGKGYDFAEEEPMK